MDDYKGFFFLLSRLCVFRVFRALLGSLVGLRTHVLILAVISFISFLWLFLAFCDGSREQKREWENLCKRVGWKLEQSRVEVRVEDVGLR